MGSVDCPRCHVEVLLIEDDDFPGLAEAVHCGLLIADWWDGTFVYDLSAGMRGNPQ